LKKVMKKILKALNNRENLDIASSIVPAIEPLRHNDKIILLMTVPLNSKQYCIFQGRGKNLHEAVKQAMETFLQNSSREANIKSVRLDIVSAIKPVHKNRTVPGFRDYDVLYRKGAEGLAIGRDLGVIFLPGEVLRFKLIDDKKIQPENLLEAMKAYPRYPIDEQIMNQVKSLPEQEIYKVAFLSYHLDQYGYSYFNDGVRQVLKINEPVLQKAILLAKNNYFKKVVGKKGKYIYSYLPFEDTKEKRYNLLRHAGTTYSILETLELFPDDQLLENAVMTIDYLVAQTRQFQVKDKQVCAVIEKDNVKLGGNALAIIALAKYTRLTNDYRYLPLMQGLGKWIFETQDQQGQFTVHKQDYNTGVIDEFTSNYYPGEAVLALTRLYQLDGDENWLDAAEKGVKYLIQCRDRDHTSDTITHDHWLLYGLNELYRERSLKLFLEHAFFIAEAIVKHQITDQDQNSNGAYYFPHPRLESTPTAVRTEGLCAAYLLARDFGYEKEAVIFEAAIRKGIRFQLQTQVWPADLLFYKRKKRCLGAFKKGLRSYDLRIDYTQHNISSLLAYYKILNGRI